MHAAEDGSTKFSYEQTMSNLHLGVFKCVVLNKHDCTSYKVKGSLYHVPEEVGHPVHQWTDTTDKLQVFGLGNPLLD